MVLNANGFISHKGEIGSGVILRRFHRALRSLWRCKRAPGLMTGGGGLRTAAKPPPFLLACDQKHRRKPLGYLPFGLLHIIFLEACTDGGRTGCSLSLVSKDIRRLSRASRFHSVSLLTPSLWKLRLFQQAYDKARDAAIREDAPWTTPRVRHLCLLVNLPYFIDENLDVKPAKQDF